MRTDYPLHSTDPVSVGKRLAATSNDTPTSAEYHAHQLRRRSRGRNGGRVLFRSRLRTAQMETELLDRFVVHAAR